MSLLDISGVRLCFLAEEKLMFDTTKCANIAIEEQHEGTHYLSA